jgi:hypothetical protein
MNKLMKTSGHARGMSDHAPFYALIILAGIGGAIILFIAGLIYLLL